MSQNENVGFSKLIPQAHTHIIIVHSIQRTFGINESDKTFCKNELYCSNEEQVSNIDTEVRIFIFE